MAQTVTLSLETELLTDAFDDLKRAARAIHRHHGSEVRSLDRRIAAIVEGDTPIEPPVLLKELLKGEGNNLIVVAVPPKQITDLVKEARRLGVI